MSNVSQLGTSKDREFFRVDGNLYLQVEPVTLDQGIKQDDFALFVPTFSQDEDDIVGLSIDAFREHVLLSDMEPAQKEQWLRTQQLLSMMKRFLDARLAGHQPKMFLKTNVNISGSGLAYASNSPQMVGQTLRLSLFFSRYPYTYLCLISEVVKCDKRDAGYWIKTDFQDISEKNQDEVLRFVNQCQRDTRKR